MYRTGRKLYPPGEKKNMLETEDQEEKEERNKEFGATLTVNFILSNILIGDFNVIWNESLET